MISLYTFGANFGLPDSSPFVHKAMALLKIAQLPHEIQVVSPKDLGKAPKGKLPYIEDAGEIVADSAFIRWHIEQKYGYDFDRGLSKTEKAAAWALEKMLEDNLYWLMVDVRWLDDANFAKGPAHFFDGLPPIVRNLVRLMVRSKQRKTLNAHGIGRHTAAEKLAIAKQDIASVAALLDDKPYLFGNEPCGADASAYAFMAGVLCPHFESPIRDSAESHANLVAYVHRMKTRYFP
ncbi:MAG TPA: glutathione S-transferase family protein [Burkholderiaceae bacterium]|nr:glutathione S-transferase family protein [Burkholderiaceae bacterium]